MTMTKKAQVEISIIPRGWFNPSGAAIRASKLGESAQPTLTKTKTMVVARLTELAGADQSSQLYM